MYIQYKELFMNDGCSNSVAIFGTFEKFGCQAADLKN